MNRKLFLEQPDVLGLIEWLVENLPTLPVHQGRFISSQIRTHSYETSELPTNSHVYAGESSCVVSIQFIGS